MNNVAVVVLSCDKYNDLWVPFFQSFWEYWSNCPYKIYLVSNTIELNDDRVNVIYTGKDIDWSSSYIKALNKIEEEFLFIFLEDIFLVEKVDQNRVQNYCIFMINNNGNHFHYSNKPKPCRVDKNVGLYSRFMPYRVNVLGFWKRDYLLNLLLPGETAWDFEIMGSYRTSYDDGFYCAIPPLFKWLNVVEKGKWKKYELDYCVKKKYKINLEKRENIEGVKQIYCNFNILLFWISTSISWKIRLKIMNILRKIFSCY